MGSIEVDRDLLFGLLAAKVELLTTDDLLAGLKVWGQEKSRPLAEILVERGCLTPDRRELIAGLVAEYLKAHDGDPAIGLAHLSGIEAVALSIQGLGDPELTAKLSRVGAGSEAESPTPDDPFATRSPDAIREDSVDPFETLVKGPGPVLPGGQSPRPEGFGARFRIVRMHAKGGLGVVSLAIDRELDRAVALKEIQDRHADEPRNRSRFLVEAEITGKLEHPGIIPVYGLGTYADGRPYYAMRFVRGDSLRQAIDRFHRDPEAKALGPGDRRVRLHQLLGRFADVCQAIGYAHSRGILHRDIKPGNVMLGPYGETLVVDWGLAKPIDGPDVEEPTSDGPTGIEPDTSGTADGSARVRLSLTGGSTEETLPGQAIGTPAYMSPEQAEGRVEELGVASDIYSLGATLYCLLTGKAPIEGANLTEILDHVIAGKFPPPRERSAAIPRPLEAICLKAMALRPEDRYPDALALVSDIERWRSDEPVSAWREPWGVRAARWVRHHKTLVASAAVGLIAVGLGVGAVLVQAAIQQARETDRADRLVLTLGDETDIDAVPALVREVGQFPDWIDAKLRVLRDRSAESTPARRNANLALLPRHPELALEISDLILDESASLNTIEVLGTSLEDYGIGLRELLWKTVREPPTPEDFGRWLRAVRTLRWNAERESDPQWDSVAARLMGRIDTGDVAARRVAVLGLGMLPDPVVMGRRERLRESLLNDYRSEPDSGLHSALGWLLRERLDLAAEVEAIDRQLGGRPVEPGFGWFLDGQGRAYAIVPGVEEFRMGTPAEEAPDSIRAEVEQYEPPHRRAIPRRFAIATTEVTASEFAGFLADHPDVGYYGEDQAVLAPGADAPAISVSWYEAARFCRWLSEREAIAPDQMPYPPVDRIKPGFEADLPADFLDRTGYRLPTEAEWEYAARGGSEALRPFGDGAALIDQYAWWGGNSPDLAAGLSYPHAREVGMKLPNGLGLFDVLGNVMEWCHDPYRPYPETPEAGPPFPDGADGNPTPADRLRIVRGHSFAMPSADYLRSGQRDLLDPLTVNSTIGFRVARTLPPIGEPTQPDHDRPSPETDPEPRP